MQTEMVQGYLSTAELKKRYKCSRTTLLRKQWRKENPFPKPRIAQHGSENLWAIDDVEQWEAKEHDRCAA